MTLRIHAPNPIRVGETKNVLVTSDNPGVVSLTYGAGLTGPASVVIPGTRVWRNGLKHGQYLSCDGAATASRNNFTLFVAVMTDTLRRSTSAYTYAFPIGNLFDNGSSRALTNWGLCAYRLPTANPLIDTGYFAFLATPAPPAGSSSSYGFSAFGCNDTPTLVRLAVTYDGTTLRRMINSRGVASVSTVAISGTCGSEYLRVQHPLEVLAKLESVASDADLDAWFSNGTLPSGLSLNLSGGHEIVESAPVFWDSAGTNDLKTAVIPPGSYPAAASGDYTDDPLNPVVPYAIVPVTAVATTGTTIDATRPRQGVPARASEAERIESADQVTVTVAYAAPVVPEMAPNDTLQLFPEWLWTEPHTQGIAAVMDDRRAAFVSDLDHLLIYDFENQTSAILDLVADMFGVYGWNKAAGTTEKVAFLESSLKILRKSGTHYAVKEAIRLVCDAAKIEDITILPGAGNVYDGEHDFDGSINYDSLFHWAKFDVEIETTDATYFTADLQAVIINMINHYKPASRWLENLIITEI